MNSKEFKDFMKNGEVYCKQIRKLIGQALFLERQKRRYSLPQLSEFVGISDKTIEEVELAKEKPHWGAVEILLDFYGKTMALRLTDAPTEGLKGILPPDYEKKI